MPETELHLIRDGEVEPVKASAADLADAATLGVEHGARRLWRRRLLRGLAAEMLGVHPDRIEIERTAQGGLKIAGPIPLCASVAGRGPWTALAVAPHPVGVDVEVDPPDRDPPFDLLQPLEQEAILADAHPVRRFLCFWTAREAYLKAEGRGLEIMPDRVRAASRGAEVALIEQGRPIVFARLVQREEAIAAIVELGTSA